MQDGQTSSVATFITNAELVTFRSPLETHVIAPPFCALTNAKRAHMASQHATQQT